MKRAQRIYLLIGMMSLWAGCAGGASGDLGGGPPGARLGETTPRVSVGPGAVESPIRQVVRTAGGRVYIAAADDNGGPANNFTTATVLRMYRATATGVPTAFAEVDAGSARRPSVGRGRTLSGGDARLDAAGVMHVVYYRGDSGATVHQTFDTGADQWGAAEELPGTRALGDASDARFGQRGAGVNALALDRSGAVYVAVGGYGALRIYRKGVGGAFVAERDLSSGYSLHPSMTIDRQDRLHVAWLEEDKTIRYAQRSAAGVWTAAEVVASGNPAVLSNGNLDQSPSVAVDAADRALVLYVSGTPGQTDNLARLKLRVGAGSWQAEDPAVYTHTPGLYLRGDARLVLLGHDAAIHPGYLTRSGAAGSVWSATEIFQPTGIYDGSAAARFDPQGDVDCSVVDVVYFDEDSDLPGREGGFKPDLFYTAIRLPGC